MWDCRRCIFSHTRNRKGAAEQSLIIPVTVAILISVTSTSNSMTSFKFYYFFGLENTDDEFLYFSYDCP